MTEKVFGFVKKNKRDEPTKNYGCWVFTDEIVPVVSLKWMNEYCKKREKIFGKPKNKYTKGAKFALQYIHKAAKKESEK